MDRLTFDGRFCDIAKCSLVPGGSFCESGSCSQRKTWERLKAYEDTGLCPEDIDALRAREQGLVELLARVSCGCAVTYDRLRELAQAERAGRLVVLPCKVGDTVYRVVGLCSWPGAECPDESRSCSKCRETRKVIIEAKIENIEGAVIISEYWGKTVFATRQEAEAAVEGKEVNDDA